MGIKVSLNMIPYKTIIKAFLVMAWFFIVKGGGHIRCTYKPPQLSLM